jgi:hypothetical protein
MELVRVANYPRRELAELAVTTLKAYGIEAMIQSESAGIWGSPTTPTAQGFTVVVEQKNAERAKELLSEDNKLDGA